MRILLQQLQYDYSLRQQTFLSSPALGEQWSFLLNSAYQIGQLVEDIKNVQIFQTQANPGIMPNIPNGFSMYGPNQPGIYIDQPQIQ